MDANNRFTIHQQIPSKGAVSVATFTKDKKYFMVICNERDTTGVYEQKSVVYTWDVDSSMFSPIQEIDTVACQKVHMFTASNGLCMYINNISALKQFTSSI